jgi:hypothetical protein
MKSSSIVAGLLASLCLSGLPTAASADVYDIVVTPNGDQVRYRYWGGGDQGYYFEAGANPNIVYHNYSWGYGDAAATYLTFDLTTLPFKAGEVLSVSLNIDVTSIWTNGRDDVANLSTGGTVYASQGTGLRSFDITSSFLSYLPSGAATYVFDYTGYSGFQFGSAEGLDPAYLRITTSVPEPETYAMLAIGLGLIGAMARRRKAALA